MNARLVRALLLSAVLPFCRSAAAQTDSALARAQALLREVPLIDGHNDLPWEMRTRVGSSFDSLDIARPQPKSSTRIPDRRSRAWASHSLIQSGLAPPLTPAMIHSG